MRTKVGKIKSLRLEAGMSKNGLARVADLDRATVAAAEMGKSVTELTLARIAKALSRRLGRDVQFDELIE